MSNAQLKTQQIESAAGFFRNDLQLLPYEERDKVINDAVAWYQAWSQVEGINLHISKSSDQPEYTNEIDMMKVSKLLISVADTNHGLSDELRDGLRQASIFIKNVHELNMTDRYKDLIATLANHLPRNVESNLSLDQKELFQDSIFEHSFISP